MPTVIASHPRVLQWDIYCRLVDNYGDVGVCWRLAIDLAQRRHSVRLFLDDSSPLNWMAPTGHPGVQVIDWQPGIDAGVRDVVVSAFSCELDEPTLRSIGERYRQGHPCVWIALEYLSAEAFSERSHGCPAPVLHGPATGAPRFAFYPGFAPATGGLLRAPDLAVRRSTFVAGRWLKERGIEAKGQWLISMFCYEPPLLARLLAQLAQSPHPPHMLVCTGRSAQAVGRALSIGHEVATSHRVGALTLSFLPPLTQEDYDHLLWSCDLNFVRGEDSLVRAIWAGRAFVWQVYPQQDQAHRAKLRALLERLDGPPSLGEYWERWNAEPAPTDELADLQQITKSWRSAIENWRQQMLKQTDLTSQLIEFGLKAG